MRHRILHTALVLFFLLIPSIVVAQDEASVEERLYNFDDMLIDGSFKDPQGMFERARSEAKIESVLDLKRTFIPRMEENAQESSMRP